MRGPVKALWVLGAVLVAAGTASAQVPPGPFSLTSPYNGATGVSLIPALQWEVAAGATSYLVEVDDDPVMGSPAYPAQTTGTTYTLPIFTVRGLTTYYWMVTASNENGDRVSAEFSFTTEADVVPPLG